MKKIMGSKTEQQPTPICGRKNAWHRGWLRHLLSLSLALNPLLLLISLHVPAAAATISATTVYVVEGTNTSNSKNIHGVDPTTGVLTATIFTAGVTSTAGMALDPVGLALYYADRTTTPNQLRRYNGTTETASIGTFSGTSSGNVILRMGFSGPTGYAIDSNNNAFSFTNTAPSTITSLGMISFYGTAPSGTTSSGDIAFDGNGRGWAIFGNSLYRMDFNSSPIVAYPIGQVSIGATLLSTGTYTVGSIAFAPSGALLIGAISGSDTTIYQVNMNDASAIKIGSTLTGVVISDFASGNAPNLNPTIVATKSVSPTGSVGPGDTLTYTIEIENTGNVPAVATAFADAIPAGTTYVANSASLNGATLGAASYPFSTPYTINGRNASASALKVGNANRATVSYQVVVSASSPPAVVYNSGIVTYLDGPGGGVPSNQTTTNVNSIVPGYKSVKLTNDADSNGAVTPGDTLTWTVSYANTSALAAPSFQINDPLPANVTIAAPGGQTITTSGSGTTASKNISYTGASAGAVSDLLAAGATLGANSTITVSIPTIVNAGFSGTLSNQAHATGSTLVSGGVYSDNIDSTTSGLPSGVTVPAGSIAQTQGAGTDATTASVTILVTVSGKVWGDADNSANNTFTNINTGAETGTNAGNGIVAVLVDASSNVITASPVSSDGTYSFSNVLASQSNVTIRLATTSGSSGTPAPAAGVPGDWTNTSPLTTAAFNIVISNITGKDFGIEQLPISAATNPASQTNPGGTTLVAVPSTHFTGTDADGTVVSFKFTTFPANATSLTINSTNYTAGTFPIGGVSVTAVSGALPANMVSVDPVDGAVSVPIAFTVTDNASKESASAATVNVVFALAPDVTLVKNCPSPVTCLTASQPPGTDLTYTITFTNGGGSSAQSLTIVDAIPDNTDFKLSSVTSNLGTTGLTVVVDYSSDYNPSSPSSATWLHGPTSGGGSAAIGYDRNVKAIRWRLIGGNLSPTAPNNTGDVSFTVKIR